MNIFARLFFCITTDSQEVIAAKQYRPQCDAVTEEQLKSVEIRSNIQDVPEHLLSATLSSKSKKVYEQYGIRL